MADVLFYEDSIRFDHDDPDFQNDEVHTAKKSNHQGFSTGFQTKMSLGMLESTSFCYPADSWLIRTDSVESLVDSRLDSMMCRVDPAYHGHVNETSMTIEDIRSHFNSCNSCGVCWSDNHVSLDCKECGGYSLRRPCPMCDGKCKAVWTRDVSMTHDNGKAHWEGECKLPREELPAVPTFLAEDVLIQGFEDLSTSSS